MWYTYKNEINTSRMGRKNYDDWPSGCGISLYHEPSPLTYCRGITAICGDSEEEKGDDFVKCRVNTKNGPLTLFGANTPKVVSNHDIRLDDCDKVLIKEDTWDETAPAYVIKPKAENTGKFICLDSGFFQQCVKLPDTYKFDPVKDATFVVVRGPFGFSNYFDDAIKTLGLKVVKEFGEFYNNHISHQGYDGKRLTAVIIE